MSDCTPDISKLTDEPKTLKEIRQRPDASLFFEAMGNEMTNLAEKKVYKEMELPEGKVAISSGWVHKIKRHLTGQVDKYRSRCVAKGYSQQEGVDYNEVYAPTSSTTTLRIILAMTAQLDLELDHLDVRTAFMNGELQEEVYMKIPPGFEVPGKVWLLLKAINGLKQAALAWYAKMTAQLESRGFKVSETDPCMFMATIMGSKVFVIAHVDDLLVAGPKQAVQIAKRQIAALFEVKDMGAATHFLGLEIRRNREKKTLWLGQTKYIQEALVEFSMDSAKSRIAPLDAGTSLIKEGEPVQPNTPYRKLVGTLLYLSTKTRPDIAHAVGMMTRHCSAPTKEHWEAGKQILRYLTGTQNLGLLYTDTKYQKAYGYSDADYAGDKDGRKSISAHVFIYGGAAISWHSKLQATVATSTCEAEFVAGAAAVKEALFITKVFAEITGTWKAIMVLCDNQSAMKVLQTPEFGAQNRLKHVDIAFHFARNRVARQDVRIAYISTTKMVADALTKQLPGPGHCGHRAQMGVHACH